VKRYSISTGAYTEAEVIYTETEMLALSDSLTAEDRSGFPSTGDLMRYYWRTCHSRGDADLPSCRAQARVADGQDPQHEQPSGLFDMGGTIITSNVVDPMSDEEGRLPPMDGGSS